MPHYKDLFTEEYMEDWSYKTNEWETPIEKRVKCDCDAKEYITIIMDHGVPPLFQSCDQCGKLWCGSCGDPKRMPGTPYDDPSAHSTEANPNACKNTLAVKTQQRQAKVAGLTKGKDYQICPMCNRYCEESLDIRCEGCHTGFCFICGQKQPGHPWVPGQTCTFWKPDQYHP
jgi:hypothetical protein